MTDFKTEQEQFWAGEFGNEYVSRNKRSQLISSNVVLFSKILARADSVSTVIEFGSNIGLNLTAIKKISPAIELSAVEINAMAVEELSRLKDVKVYHQSILDFVPDYQRDMVLVKGVLIHMNPEVLQRVYDILYKTASRYLCVVEYYNPTPVEVPYRGHSGKLFKRDFAGELLDRYNNLRLVDYGFAYHRDKSFPLDDITWFLLDKK